MTTDPPRRVPNLVQVALTLPPSIVKTQCCDLERKSVLDVVSITHLPFTWAGLGISEVKSMPRKREANATQISGQDSSFSRTSEPILRYGEKQNS